MPSWEGIVQTLASSVVVLIAASAAAAAATGTSRTRTPSRPLSRKIPESEVRWGIIGVGDVCEVKAGPGFYNSVGSRLVAVMRRSLDKARDFASRHGVPRCYDRVEDLLADREVNAVYIASPVHAHLEHALAAARAGKPTLLEKPMARCAEEAQMIVDAFRTAGVPLYVAYYRRAHPAPLELQRLLGPSGPAGRVLSCEYELSMEVSKDVEAYNQHPERSESDLPWRLNPQRSGAGLVLDVGTHAVDLMEFLLGPLEVTGGEASRSEAYGRVPVEDHVELRFTARPNEDGSLVRGRARWDFAQPRGRGKFEELRIVCENMTLVSRPLASDGVAILRHGRGGRAEEFLDLKPPAHVHQNLIQSVVNELLGAGAVSAAGFGLVALGACPSTGDTGVAASAHLDLSLREFYGPRGQFFGVGGGNGGGGGGGGSSSSSSSSSSCASSS